MLPEVFQDAITVARRLSIPYLWIDSLCILQDSKRDWEREAAKMGQYYQNAHLTIAASSSANSSQRFLKERDLVPVDFNIKSPDQDDGAYCVRIQPLRQANMDEITWPLSTRGWTFQENVLSKRVVHFTNEQVIWECRGCIESDMRPSGSGLGGLIRNFHDVYIGVYRAWHRIVERYSSRQLTYPTDKLPALSGIVAVYHGVTKSAYLAGLWRDNLQKDLVWYSQQLDPWRPRVSGSAPSWSWASIDWHVTFAFVDVDQFKPEFTVVDAQCTVPGLNPFGEVAGGSVTITGPLIEATLSNSGPSYSNCFHHTFQSFKLVAHDDSNCYHLEFDGRRAWTTRILPDTYLEGYQGTSGPTLRRAQPKAKHVPFSAPVVCLKMGVNPDTGALVLVPSESVAGAYERIGFWKTGQPDGFEGAPRKSITIV